MNIMTTLDLNKLRKRIPSETFKRPKKKIDRFDGLSEEEVQKYTLEDYLETNLDVVFVGINPSLMAAHRGRYYAGPGNHFYKLLHESGLTPRFVSYEEDYKLLQYSIGLTNIVARATRSAADLKRTEIKEGARIVEEKLRLYKPKVAVFNGKCIYEVFANITSKSTFHFGLQPEHIGDTAIWVTPSSSARCANFPRMVDKLHFYTALKRYLHFLKGEIADVDVKEFWFEGRCKQSVPSTSKMWRRKNISTFLHGGRVVNKNTLSQDTSEEDIAPVHAAEFLVQTCDRERSNKSRDIFLDEKKTLTCGQENQALFDEMIEKIETNTEGEKSAISNDISDGATVDDESENKEVSDIGKKETRSTVVNNILNQGDNVTICKNGEECASSKIPHRTRDNLMSSKADDSLDFMSLIKQRLSQKNNSGDASRLKHK